MDGAATTEDLSALAWVHGELRRSLEIANKALRRYLREAEAVSGSDVDAVDPAVLRTARTQLHQGVGALELVGLPAVADVLRAAEAAVQRMVARPTLVTAASVDTVERASFALLDFLSRQLAGKPVSPVMLFPQYRAAQQLAGADRVHPADLWKIDWQWRDVPADGNAIPRNADDAARSEMETLVLGLMRQDGRQDGRQAARHDPTGVRDTLARVSNLCADIAAGVRTSLRGGAHAATQWQLAAAVFEALDGGLLAYDVYAKRLASRLMAQLRLRTKGHDDVSERLAQDLLFFCSHAAEPGAARPAPRLAAVRRAFNLDALPTADYETPRLGRFDPAVLALARKRVAAARDTWSAVAGGEQHRLAALSEQFTLVGESLQRLFPGGDALAQALGRAAAQTLAADGTPPAALAMEVATSILWLDASLEDGDLDQAEQAQRVQRLAGRIDAVAAGAEQEPLDGWMEELYRRVSDRQTMGSVVAELRASLSEVEKQIDQYFRDPGQRQVLIPVPAQLSAMRGVLSVLGLAHASAAALHMRDDVAALAETEVDPQRAVQAGTFDRLADNLGALSFLIDMLAVQPTLAKSLFRFDPETGNLSAVMGQSERASAFAAFDETLPAAAGASLLEQLQALAGGKWTDAELARRLEPLAAQAFAADQAELARLLNSARRTLSDADGSEDERRQVRSGLAEAAAVLAGPAVPELPPPAPLPPPAKPAGGADNGLEDDAEMREIFIEEAQEVVADARAALDRLADAPDNAADMTAVRRAFHTLKGSARMVGLRGYGDAAWACEQLYNARLAQMPRMDGALRTLSGEALDYLADWTEAIAAGAERGHRAADVAAAADALREQQGVLLPIALPGGAAKAAGPAEPVAVATAGGTPALVAPSFELQPDEPAAAPAPAEVLAFDFDFDLDDAASPAPVAAADALTTRVPDLPSAADLELRAPRPAGEALPPPVARASVSAPVAAPETAPALLDFEFDLGAFAEPARPEELPLDAPPAEAAGLPLPAAEALEIDFAGAFDEAFAAAEAEPAPPVEAAPVSEAQPVAERLGEPVAQPEPEREPQPEPAPESAPEHANEEEARAERPDDDDEQVKVIGGLRIGIPLFNIFLNEADELSRRLRTELAEWALEHDQHAVPASSEALAHALAGSSATVGYVGLSALARALEHALMRSHAQGRGQPGEAALFTDAAEEIRRLLHQFAAGFLRPVAPGLLQRLAESERQPSASAPADEVEAAAVPSDGAIGVADGPAVIGDSDGFDEPIDAVDEIDAELLPIFEEEADELLPQLQARLRDWLAEPAETAAAAACMRTLHTVKGGARLAGAMRLGELAHRLETAIEARIAHGGTQRADIEPLLAQADAMSALLDSLRHGAPALPHTGLSMVPPHHAPSHHVPPPAGPLAAQVPTPPDRAPPPALPVDAAAEPVPVDATAPSPAAAAEPAPAAALPAPAPAAPPPIAAEPPPATPAPAPAPAPRPAGTAETPAGETPTAATPAPPPPVPPVLIDWQRFAARPLAGTAAPPAAAERLPSATAVVRVRAGLLDRMVNQAGEVSITRARIDADVKQLQGALGELTESLERMRRQLRDIELQAETQISSRMEAAKAAAQGFDPLEMDRFTRFQELTRFMAESVNDVATLQRGLQRTLQNTEDELAAQARLTRELQDDLLRTRMVEFESLADRLYRTARQAARDTGKQVKLDVVGGAIEVDRGVLERMAGPFEHLLRNGVAHGIEAPDARRAAGKDAVGQLTITVAQSGNEVAVDFADDGGGLDLQRIRERAVARGLLAAGQASQTSDSELAQLIFRPGFSTVDAVTELAGRGVGMDVVRAEVNAMGGRIETTSERGKGTRFRLLLPLTTAVTQVVMLRCGELQVAVPATLIETVRRMPSAEVEAGYAGGSVDYAGEAVPLHWLAALLQGGSTARGSTAGGRTHTVVIVRSAAQRVALHIDEVMGNQEVVVKNVGPQLSRLPGLAGVTLLPSGAVALIYNPVALANLYGPAVRAALARGAAAMGGAPDETAAPQAALVMVVDDSLTVRRVTQRLLVREGYRVVTAKDGLEALERLAEERPAVLLSDIEMPRMDGFDLLRNVRADARLAGLPVVMITSRIAQKHRDYAIELGADHYLGKPYAEEELLGLVARHAGADIAV